MNPLGALIGLIVIIMAVGGFAFKDEIAKVVSPGPTSNPETRFTLDIVYDRWGGRTGVSPALLQAIAIVESNENPNAKNPLDPSYGLMQLLCTNDSTGRRVCKNVLNLDAWPPNSKDQLFDPNYSVEIGSQILKWNQDTYGFKKGIAMYNNYGARFDPENGPFRNQSYVNKVLNNFRELRGGNTIT